MGENSSFSIKKRFDRVVFSRIGVRHCLARTMQEGILILAAGQWWEPYDADVILATSRR
jgi:hypothetical protein